MKTLILSSILLSASLSSPVALLKPEGQESVQVRPEAEFAKLSLTFRRPQKISRVSVESCERPFNDGVEFFLYPGFRSSYVEGGKRVLDYAVPKSKDPVATLSIVFGHNKNLCLRSIKVWEGMGEPVSFAIDPGAVSALPATISPLEASGEMVAAIVDREYTNKDKDELWRYRFRSDGTFFIRGFANDVKVSREFSAFGVYKVLSTSKKGVRLQIDGQRYPTPGSWDGVVCTRDCGLPEVATKPVKEIVEVEKANGGAVFIRNRSDRSLRTLPFSDLKVRPSTLSE